MEHRVLKLMAAASLAVIFTSWALVVCLIAVNAFIVDTGISSDAEMVCIRSSGQNLLCSDPKALAVAFIVAAVVGMLTTRKRDRSEFPESHYTPTICAACNKLRTRLHWLLGLGYFPGGCF